MPELPEVENLRRGLITRVRGQKIMSVVVRKPKLVSGKGNVRPASGVKAAQFIRELKGQVIKDIERRAKNLIFIFKSGKAMLVHLKMTGQFAYEGQKGKVNGGHPIELSESKLPNKHTHIIFKLNKGTLYYNDTRTFGYLLYYPSREAIDKEGHFGELGVEPLGKDFTLEYFRAALAKKTGLLKAVLMNQSVVVGLGNIYADEACFMAKVRPNRKANRLKPSEVKSLYAAIKKIIPRAIKAGGSSVATYRLIDLKRGNYAREHKVYGRGGEPCFVCGKSLKTTKIAGRTTVYCANCQK